MLCVSVFRNLTRNNIQRERLKEREREHYKSSLNIDKNYCTIRLSFSSPNSIASRGMLFLYVTWHDSHKDRVNWKLFHTILHPMNKHGAQGQPC